MQTFSGYQITEYIYESANSLVCRGRRQIEPQSVVLKILKADYPTPEKIAWFKREYEITHNLNLQCTAKAYSLENVHDRWMMVLEDFGGRSLDQLQLAGQLSVARFLALAIGITDILDQMHQQYLMHKDITPANIVFNLATEQVKIIDFGIATKLSRENTTFRNPNVLEGTPAYISPEQTGRMNRAMDYRTDLYSLGVTFYELLTGHLPFRTKDPSELVHCHIAQEPIPVKGVIPEIPQMISDIVMKLMAKNAEDRYQSAHGLEVDLRECLRQWQTTQQITSFPLAQQDVNDLFQIPQKLYGREKDITTLLSAFERVSQGASEIILVSGYAGIGKSALVQEVYKPITRQRGYFIGGKSNQFQHDIPYVSFLNAFRSLIRELLTESEEAITHWRKKLLMALGPNAQVIIQVIPEVELVVGPQPSVPDLLPTEAQNRFNLVFQNFIQVFTQPEHPLVIFLDDLQWSDGASLKLMQALMLADNSHYLLLIGAYRDNEVDAVHPLKLTVDEMKKAGIIINPIALSALNVPHTTQLMADTFHCDTATVAPLVDLVLAKTHGNPFFLNEFVKSLHTQELITFDYESNQWRWDLQQIQARDITDNVVVLMTNKVQKLPPQTQAALKLAACIGNKFDLTNLATVYQKSPQETANDLRYALVEGLLLPLNDSYKLLEVEVEGLAEKITVDYKFVHDRIQQATYSLIPEVDRQAFHLQIGRLLGQRLPGDTHEQQIFDIVNQLNLGKALIDQQAERDQLANLNWAAGRKAKASTAYQTAFSYLMSSLELLNGFSASLLSASDSWHRLYDLTLTLHMEAAELATIIGNYGQMDRLIENVLQHAQTNLEKAKAYGVMANAHHAREAYPEAMRMGKEALKLLDVEFPVQPGWPDVMTAIQNIQVMLADQPIENLVTLPQMTDPTQLAAIGIMNNLGGVARALNINLSILMTCKQLSILLKHGNSLDSPLIYANYGVVLTIMQDFDKGYQLSSLALELLGRSNAMKDKAKIYFSICYVIRHWKEPYRDLLPYLLEAFQSGVETGDLEYSANIASGYGQLLYLSGQNLVDVEQEMTKFEQAIIRFKQKAPLQWHQIYRQGVLNLLDRSQDACRLIGEAFNEEEVLQGYIEVSHYGALLHTYMWKLYLCYLFQHKQSMRENLVEMEKYSFVTEGTIVAPPISFYGSLARLALFSDASKPEQEEIQAKINANQEKMKLWAHHAPMNYLHKFYLVEAEQARVLGNDSEAREGYDKAIDLAIENQYPNDAALAYELAGRFYLIRGQTRIARQYLRDAHYAYQRWGAIAKVKDLEQRYPQLLLGAASVSHQTGITTITSSTGRTSALLDLTSVLKASQAISGEIQLDKLLDKLMKAVIENAGAQHGCLLLERNGQWWIEAEGVADQAATTPDGGSAITALQATPVATSERLSAAIVNYVSRTRENIVLDDATHVGLFTQDPYIRHTQPKSVLCAPLINQGKLTGILYLENNLTTGAFTPDRLEVLNLLSAQAAISIENAHLYDNLAVSEQRFRTLFEHAPLGVFEIDLSPTVPTILAANRQAERVYGWSTAEFVAMPVEQLVPPEALLQISQMINSIQSGETVTLETTSMRRRGTAFPARISATPQSGSGLNRLIVTVEDITLEKQRQAELEAIEGERRRIAHEIHDGLAQDLAALRFKTTLWHDLVDKNPLHMHAELDQLMEILNGSIREVRRSIFALRPIALDELGFFPALRQFCIHFGEQYQLQIMIEVLGPEEQLPSPLELPLFRVVQEALNNIRKHAQAHTVQIRLDLAHPQAITLTIRDDGRGFEPTTLKRAFREGHVGLKQMEERIKGINGALSVQSQVGQGTMLEVALPMREPAGQWLLHDQESA